MNQPNVIEWTR